MHIKEGKILATGNSSFLSFAFIRMKMSVPEPYRTDPKLRAFRERSNTSI